MPNLDYYWITFPLTDATAADNFFENIVAIREIANYDPHLLPMFSILSNYYGFIKDFPYFCKDITKSSAADLSLVGKGKDWRNIKNV